MNLSENGDILQLCKNCIDIIIYHILLIKCLICLVLVLTSYNLLESAALLYSVCLLYDILYLYAPRIFKTSIELVNRLWMKFIDTNRFSRVIGTGQSTFIENLAKKSKKNRKFFYERNFWLKVSYVESFTYKKN